MLPKELQDAIQHLGKKLEPALMPYAVADKIIAEVMRNGEQARETVMHMLMQYLVDSLEDRQEFISLVQEALHTTKGDKPSQ